MLRTVVQRTIFAIIMVLVVALALAFSVSVAVGITLVCVLAANAFVGLIMWLIITWVVEGE